MNLPRKTTPSAGFTLLELMIVVTIIGIVSAGIVPAFSKYIENQNLKQAQEQLKSDMRTVQNKALTGTSSDQMLGGTYIKYWGIKFVNGQPAYEYFVSTDTTCPGAYVTGAYQGKSSFNSDLLIQSASGCVFFDILNGDISTVPSGTVTISVGSSPTKFKSVLFNSFGLIYFIN